MTYQDRYLDAVERALASLDTPIHHLREDAVFLLDVLSSADSAHTVVLTRGDFTIEHPINEKLSGSLFDCTLMEWMTDLPYPPATPGRYRVYDAGEFWEFVEDNS